jgi:methionyl-tRNA formyltransferase
MVTGSKTTSGITTDLTPGWPVARLRTALLFQHNNFVGREYFANLVAAGRTPTLTIAVGEMKRESIEREIERTGGRWHPPQIPPDVDTHRFEKLSDPKLWQLISDRTIDLGIQAGVGILKSEMISRFRLGILNIHPGKLPQYRGNSCPEWALLNGDEIWATAHMIDAGIDTGPVVTEVRYDLSGKRDYFDFRAKLYSHCARTLIAALERIEDKSAAIEKVLVPQDESEAHYWPAMPDAETARVRAWRPELRKL